MRLNHYYRRRRDIVVLLAALLAVLFHLALWINTFYFQAKTSEILSFLVQDGWCGPNNPGLGKHCFGDYYSPVLGLQKGDPWSTGFAYTPVAALIFWPFIQIVNITGSHFLALLVYLCVCLLCALTPAIWVALNNRRGLGLPVSALLFGVTPVPIMSVLDRGNSLVFVLPVLVWFARSIIQRRWLSASNALVIATLIRPQFIVLVLLLIGYRRWREIVTSVLKIVVIQISGFVLLTTDPWGTFLNWLNFIRSYDSNLLIGKIGSANMSFSQAILDMSIFMETSVPVLNKGLSEIVLQNLTAITVLVVVLPCMLIFLLADSSRINYQIVTALALASQLPSVSWMYYQIFSVVVIAMMANGCFDLASSDHGVPSPQRRSPRKLITLESLLFTITATATLMACYQLPISNEVFGLALGATSSSISRFFVVPLWILSIWVLLALVLRDAKVTSRSKLTSKRITNDIYN